MSRAARRCVFALALAVFCAWLSYLAFLAWTTTHPIVLSRPQFLASQLDVIAELKAADGRADADVRVEEVVWPRGADAPQLADKTVRVANLPKVSREDGWDGPGRYILPLVKSDDHYQLAPLARSPGLERSQPRIYRDTPETMKQLREIRGVAE
jgi:hypothetical protein